MDTINEILVKIKESVHTTDPDATIILYGSIARGEQKKESDLDILILLNKDKIDRADEIRVKYPLYDIEFDTSQIISPLVLSKKAWESHHRSSPLYINVNKEGVEL